MYKGRDDHQIAVKSCVLLSFVYTIPLFDSMYPITLIKLIYESTYHSIDRHKKGLKGQQCRLSSVQLYRFSRL